MLNAPHSSSSLLFVGAIDEIPVIEVCGLLIDVVAGEPHALVATLAPPIDVPQADSLFEAVEIVAAGAAHAFASNENCGVVGCLGAAVLLVVKLNVLMVDMAGAAGAGVEEKSNKSSIADEPLGFEYIDCFVDVEEPKNPLPEVGDS